MWPYGSGQGTELVSPRPSCTAAAAQCSRNESQAGVGTMKRLRDEGGTDYDASRFDEVSEGYDSD